MSTILKRDNVGINDKTLDLNFYQNAEEEEDDVEVEPDEEEEEDVEVEPDEEEEEDEEEEDDVEDDVEVEPDEEEEEDDVEVEPDEEEEDDDVEVEPDEEDDDYYDSDNDTDKDEIEISPEMIRLEKIIKKKLSIPPKYGHFTSYSLGKTKIDECDVYVTIKGYLKSDGNKYIIDIGSFHIMQIINDNPDFYELYRKGYVSIMECLKQIKFVSKNYKLYDGKLISPKEINEEMLKKNIIPYDKNEICSVCYENTQEETICGHLLCFRCRCNIVKKTKKCPICRVKCLEDYFIENDFSDDE